MKKIPLGEAGAIPPAEPLSLAGALEYQAGAIVSRTIVKNKTGTLTIFAFDAGQELSEHTTPFDALVHCLDGRVVLTIGGKDVEAGAGEAVLMPMNVPHAVKAPERMKMLLVMFRGG